MFHQPNETICLQNKITHWILTLQNSIVFCEKQIRGIGCNGYSAPELYSKQILNLDKGIQADNKRIKALNKIKQNGSITLKEYACLLKVSFIRKDEAIQRYSEIEIGPEKLTVEEQEMLSQLRPDLLSTTRHKLASPQS